MASEIRRQVQEETGLTCSVGQGPNTLISKVASDMNKPNGQFVVENDGQAVAHFIQELPIRKVPGIGRVGSDQLQWLAACLPSRAAACRLCCGSRLRGIPSRWP